MTSNTALIRKYSCLYTPDVHKKQKVWNDGFLRFHHFNSFVVLLDEHDKVVEDRFLSIPACRKGTSSSTTCVPESFQFPPDEEITFEQHIATIDAVIATIRQDLTDLQKKRKQPPSEISPNTSTPKQSFKKAKFPTLPTPQTPARSTPANQSKPTPKEPLETKTSMHIPVSSSVNRPFRLLTIPRRPSTLSKSNTEYDTPSRLSR